MSRSWKECRHSLWMSRSWKECRHLAPDVSILERVSVTGPGCIRDGCMSCVVMSTHVSMSTYVSCTGMSRRTYGSCENCVYKEGVSRVLSSSSLHATSCILFGISTSSLFPLFPLFPAYLRIADARLAPSVPVRHVCPSLSVSLSDTSVRRSPSPCPTRLSDVVCTCPTRPSDAVHLPVRHVRLTLSVLVQHVRLTLSVSVSHSRSRSRSHSFPIPVPVPPASAPAPACVTRTHWSTLENCRRYTRLHLLF